MQSVPKEMEDVARVSDERRRLDGSFDGGSRIWGGVFATCAGPPRTSSSKLHPE